MTPHSLVGDYIYAFLILILFCHLYMRDDAHFLKFSIYFFFVICIIDFCIN